MLYWKSWALAFALATGAFWLTMASDPPRSVAADPSEAFSPSRIEIPRYLPTAQGDNTY